MQWLVNDPYGFATSLTGREGTNLTIVNQSATDVYFDTSGNASRLNGTVAGAVPQGTKIAANGGQVQFTSAPTIFLRAASQTTVEIQP